MNAPFERQPSRPTVIALHASAGTRRQWATLMSLVSDQIDVIAPNLIGHGDAPPWRSSASGIVAADAARVAELARLVPGGAHLVGHSYGGAIALRVAFAHPERVASVTVYEPVVFRLLVDHGRRTQAAAEILELGRFVRIHARHGDPERAAARFVDYWNGAGAWRALGQRAKESIAATMPVIGEQFPALVGDAMRLVNYGSLPMPVHLMAGTALRSPMRRVMELLRFAMPYARSTAMPALGHMGPVTSPDAVALAIRNFVIEQAANAAYRDRQAA